MVMEWVAWAEISLRSVPGIAHTGEHPTSHAAITLTSSSPVRRIPITANNESSCAKEMCPPLDKLVDPPGEMRRHSVPNRSLAST